MILFNIPHMEERSKHHDIPYLVIIDISYTCVQCISLTYTCTDFNPQSGSVLNLVAAMTSYLNLHLMGMLFEIIVLEKNISTERYLYISMLHVAAIMKSC